MTITTPTLWLAQEQVRLRTEQPRVWSALQTVLRFRVVVLASLCGLLGGAVSQQTVGIGDLAQFLRASRELLSSNGLNVFHDASLQVGPLYLLALGLISLIAEGLHLPVAFLAGFVQAAGLTWLCIYLVRTFSVRAQADAWVRDVAIATSLLFGPIAAVANAGHFEEPLLAGFLLLAAERMSRGRDTTAVLWLVLATGFKLWGVLGIPILLMNGSPVPWIRRGATYAAGIAACYLPFFLWGQVHTFTFGWHVYSTTTLGFFIPSGHPFSWRLRVLQGAMVCLVAGAVALRSRALPWAVPTTIIAVRLLFDPEQVSYYWVPLVMCLMVVAWARVDRNRGPLWLLTSLGSTSAILMPDLVGVRSIRDFHTMALAATIGAVLLAVRQAAHRPVSPAAG